MSNPKVTIDTAEIMDLIRELEKGETVRVEYKRNQLEMAHNVIAEMTYHIDVVRSALEEIINSAPYIE